MTIPLWISLNVEVDVSSLSIDTTGECKDNLSRLNSKIGQLLIKSVNFLTT
ncbi:hypothetical protein QUB21_13310 [Microcoleus sp. AT9b-C4]